MNKVRCSAMLIVLLALVNIHPAAAQDIALSQPYFAPLLLGPAQAGAANVPRVNVVWKNQWPRLDGGFRETYFSYDQPSDLVHGGVGGYYQQSRDTNGITLYRMYASANFSFITGSGDVRFVGGAEVGYVHGTLKFSEYFNAPEGLYQSEIDYADAGVSVGVHSHRYSVIAGVKHLNRPHAGFDADRNDRLAMKLTVGLTAHIPVGGRYGESEVSPVVYYTMQADTQTLMLGLMWQKGRVLGSCSYRNRDSWNISAGLQFDRFRILYTYDICVSPVARKHPGGSHEVSLMLFLKPVDRRKVFPSLEHNGF